MENIDIADIRHKNIVDNDKLFLNLVSEKYLQVFEDGRVKNLKTDRFIGAVGSGQYFKISCKIYGKVRHIQIHRLVYLVFKGEIPLSCQINHIDGNKLNNNITNLEIVTTKENSDHAKGLGLMKYLKGELNGNAVFTDEQVIEMRKLYSEGYLSKDLAIKFGSTLKHIQHLIAGKSYKHLPILKKKYETNTSFTTKFPESIAKIKELHMNGLSSYKIADQIPNISRATIQRIIQKIIKKIEPT